MSVTAQPVLLVGAGPHEGNTIPLVQDQTIIGRDSATDIVVNDPKVSRQHAVIRMDENGFWITDLGSRNGTFLNGTRIEGEARKLTTGDRIELGGMATYWVFMESQETIEAARLTSTVTVMFTDIIDSTKIADRLGDLRARELLRVHDQMIRRQTTYYGGTEVKSMGDGFMLTFTSAHQGVSCAVAMQQHLAEHNQKSPASPIWVRIGLSVGEPVREEKDLFGHSVDLAARICAEAQGGQVLVSEVIPALVGGTAEFTFTGLGAFELKGLSGTHQLYEVRWN